MIPDRPIEEINDQAVVIKNDNPNESDIYRNKLTPEGTPLTTVSKKGCPGYVDENYSASTIYEMFEVGKTIGDKFLGKRGKDNGPYEYITFGKFFFFFFSSIINYLILLIKFIINSIYKLKSYKK